MKTIAVLLTTCMALASCNNGGGGSTVAGIWAIDLTTGDRTPVTALEGTDRTPRGIAFDPVGDKAYLITSFQVIVVDAATGIPTVVASPALGTGPDFSLLHAIAIDPANNRAFVYDSPGVILVVDLATGNRTIVSDADTGTGPAFTTAVAAMAYDATLGRLIVAAPALAAEGDAVVAVDPVTGNRSVISSSTTGTGPAFSFGDSLSLAADFVAGVVHVAEDSTVIEVALANGDRTLLHTGPTYRSAIAADVANVRVLQVRGGVLLGIDTATAGTTVLSDDGTGTGPALAEPRGLEIDAARTRALVAAYAFE